MDAVAEQLLAAFVHAPSGIALIAGDGTLLRVNPALARMCGRTEEDLLRLRWQEFIHPDDLQPTLEAVEGLLAGTGELDLVIRPLRPDGGEVLLRATASGLEPSASNPARLVVHYEDVTEHVAMERAARTAEGRFAAIVEAAPDAIVTKDIDDRVMTWNPSATRIFGVPAAEAIGRNFEEIVVPEHAHEHELYRRLREEALAGRPGRIRMESRRADGSTFPSEISAARLPDGEGTVCIVRDISELIEAELELQERAAQLERSNADLEGFAYAASHDLQEPLRSIQLSAGAVIRAAAERLHGEERELLEHVDAAAERMSRQVRALMDVARVAIGRAPGEPVPVDEAVDDALASLRAAIESSGAHVDVEGPLPAAAVPRAEMALVLQNVIANAIKFRHPDEPPRIRISGAVRDGQVEIDIADNGIGIAKDDLRHVFGMFSRAPSDVPGLGLGLAVSQRVLARRGGSIWVSSEGPGRGARFTVRLPAATGHPAEAG
jgi:PAS domain S-box-containing protein